MHSLLGFFMRERESFVLKKMKELKKKCNDSEGVKSLKRHKIAQTLFGKELDRRVRMMVIDPLFDDRFSPNMGENALEDCFHAENAPTNSTEAGCINGYIQERWSCTNTAKTMQEFKELRERETSLVYEDQNAAAHDWLDPRENMVSELFQFRGQEIGVDKATLNFEFKLDCGGKKKTIIRCTGKEVVDFVNLHFQTLGSWMMMNVAVPSFDKNEAQEHTQAMWKVFEANAGSLLQALLGRDEEGSESTTAAAEAAARAVIERAAAEEDAVMADASSSSSAEEKAASEQIAALMAERKKKATIKASYQLAQTGKRQRNLASAILKSSKVQSSIMLDRVLMKLHVKTQKDSEDSAPLIVDVFCRPGFVKEVEARKNVGDKYAYEAPEDQSDGNLVFPKGE